MRFSWCRSQLIESRLSCLIKISALSFLCVLINCWDYSVRTHCHQHGEVKHQSSGVDILILEILLVEWCLTPFHCPSLYDFRAEKCTHMSTNSIFSGPITNLISILWLLMKIRSRGDAKKSEKDYRFEISHFYWLFSNDILAVKGLINNTRELISARRTSHSDTTTKTWVAYGNSHLECE